MDMEHAGVDDCVFVKEVTEGTEVTADNMETGRFFGLIPVFILLLIMFIRIIFVLYKSKGQKTRSTQQRRAYMGSRQRPSDTQEPTIYVSPANLPPPPKYEAMAPPSYEEVVGIHYPNYQPQIQPITQPLTTALAQTSTESSIPGNGNNSTVGNGNTVSGSSLAVTNVLSGNSNVVPNESSGNSNSQVSSTVITVTSDDRR